MSASEANASASYSCFRLIGLRKALNGIVTGRVAVPGRRNAEKQFASSELKAVKRAENSRRTPDAAVMMTELTRLKGSDLGTCLYFACADSGAKTAVISSVVKLFMRLSSIDIQTRAECFGLRRTAGGITTTILFISTPYFVKREVSFPLSFSLFRRCEGVEESHESLEKKVGRKREDKHRPCSPDPRLYSETGEEYYCRYEK